MNKTEMIEKISEKMGTTKVEAKRFVEATFDVIGQTLALGEEVSIANFGAFKIRERAGRTGRNPQTGEQIEIAPSKSVGFKLTKVLKEELNA